MTSASKILRNLHPSVLVFAISMVLSIEVVGSEANESEVAHAEEATSSTAEVKISSNSIEHFQDFCIDCHGADPEEISGGVDLAGILEAKSIPNLELAAKILDAMEAKRMPPADAQGPSPAERSNSVQELELSLRKTVMSLPQTETRTIRRMNRFQYNNAVVDLFQLNCIVFTLPERIMREHGRYFEPSSKAMPDVVTVGNRPLGKSQMIEPRLSGVAAFPQDLRAEHGYDNQTDHLSMSPLLMEAFLQLGTSITQSADFNPKRVGIWKTFFASPDDDAPLEKIITQRLTPFLRHAFRGHSDSQVIERYTKYAVRRIEEGNTFTDAMREVAAAVIASPKFYYLYNSSTTENDSDSRNDNHLSLDLATRLSLFLWGSIPDDELLIEAESGRLCQKQVLKAQIDRMLNDRRLKRFCDSFPSQWLQLERLISSIPNRDQYPQFYFSKYRQSMHMMLEPLLLFETVLIENRSIMELLDPNFTYRTTLLENAYGELKSGAGPLAGGGGQVTTLTFHRVPVSDRRSGGVITNAAVMTMTSGPNRTQPITRGAWVAGVIFNTPPNPPPADVPPLDENPDKHNESLTLREQLKLHRERSDCRGCHEQIDPLGFALENFDAIGRWREKYNNGVNIPSNGTIYGDRSYSNVIEFKDAILEERERYTRALTEHLVSFALARQLGVPDRFEIQKMVDHLVDSGDGLQDVLRTIMTSSLFIKG